MLISCLLSEQSNSINSWTGGDVNGLRGHKGHYRWVAVRVSLYNLSNDVIKKHMRNKFRLIIPMTLNLNKNRPSVDHNADIL